MRYENKFSEYMDIASRIKWIREELEEADGEISEAELEELREELEELEEDLRARTGKAYSWYMNRATAQRFPHRDEDPNPDWKWEGRFDRQYDD